MPARAQLTFNRTGLSGLISAHDMDRMSGLPTIKCSSCGIDIDILQLADHVCATAPLPSPGMKKRRQNDIPQAHAFDIDPAAAASVAPETALPQPSPYKPTSPKLERAATLGGPSFSTRYESQISSSRMPAPPRIDSQAASKMMIHAPQIIMVAEQLRQTFPAS